MPSKAYKTFQKNLNQVNKLIETYNHVNITVRQSRQSGVARATCPD